MNSRPDIENHVETCYTPTFYFIHTDFLSLEHFAMSFWRHYYHLVWATKKREAFMRPEIEKEIYPYIVSKAAELGCYVHAINSMPDHTHLVISIPPKHAVAWVVKTLKGQVLTLSISRCDRRSSILAGSVVMAV